MINWYFNLHPQTKYRVSTRSIFSELDMNQHFICYRITLCTGNLFNWLSSNIWWTNTLWLHHILRNSRNKMQSWSWSYSTSSWICDYLCIVSSNPTRWGVLDIQHYEIKLVSDLRQVCGFLRVLWFPAPIKLTNSI